MSLFPGYAYPANPANSANPEPGDDSLARLIRYRLNVDNPSRLVWLEPGLTKAQAIIRARARHPGASA